MEENALKVSFVAGFGPITADPVASRTFWGDDLGIGLEELSPDYWVSDNLEGVRHFGLWPLAQAAEATFGADQWPADIPAPHAWIEMDVDSAAAVAPAVAEMARAGHRVLRDAHEEPWGQTTSRLLSPEGLLIGITFTPWMHAS
jgi:hypothetical protein